MLFYALFLISIAPEFALNFEKNNFHKKEKNKLNFIQFISLDLYKILYILLYFHEKMTLGIKVYF